MTIERVFCERNARRDSGQNFHLGTFNLPVFADGITDPTTLQAQAGYYFLFETAYPTRTGHGRFLPFPHLARTFARIRSSNGSSGGVETVSAEDYVESAMQQWRGLMRRGPATFDSGPPARLSTRFLSGDDRCSLYA